MPEIISVSQCIGQLTDTLNQHFSSIWVEGEVVNLAKSPVGHWYFTLKDSKASLSCALFKYDAIACRDLDSLREGDKVKVWGRISIYATRGSLQLIAKKLLKSGKGNLIEEFEKLKSRLAAEGLFSIDTKKKIPQLPKRVGVITAPDSAALADFINVYKRRSFIMDIVVFPALVQGAQSAEQLRKALEAAIKMGMEGKLDVIVLTRGGGASEDLWSFNDEGLAWDIFNSPIPIISAVGHQVDYTIADFVADHRCETPTAAAQELTEYQMTLKDTVSSLGKRLKIISRNILSKRQTHLLEQSPQKIINELYSKLLTQKQRLERCRPLHDGKNLLKLTEFSYRLDESLGELSAYQMGIIDKKQTKLSQLHELLNAYAPHQILARGFCYIESSEDRIIKSLKAFNSLEQRENVDIIFHDGIGKVQKA